MSPANAADAALSAARVSTFELFFDLVFVLTIIRVGAVLHEEPDLLGLAAHHMRSATTDCSSHSPTWWSSPYTSG